METGTHTLVDLQELAGGYVRELQLSPPRRVTLNLVVGPHPGGPSLASEFDLQFNRVFAYEVRLSVVPALELLAVEKIESSELLQKYAALGKADLEEPLHFQLRFVEGEIDVLARSITLSLVGTMPFVRQ